LLGECDIAVGEIRITVNRKSMVLYAKMSLIPGELSISILKKMVLKADPKLILMTYETHAV